MSNKNNSNNKNKSKKAKLESSSSKQTLHNIPNIPNTPNTSNKTNPTDLHCNNCNILLDNIKNFHYIFTDEFGDIDVCGKCLDQLNMVSSNIPPNLLPPLPAPKSIVSNVPKIRLVFLNTVNNNANDNYKDNNNNNTNDKDNNNDNNKDNDKANASNLPQKDKKKKNNNKVQAVKDDKDDKDDKDGKSSKDSTENDNQQNSFTAYFTSPSIQGENNVSRCNSLSCDENQDDSGLLFFQQILNRLHGADKTACKSSTLDYEDMEIDTNEEDEDIPLEFEWLGDNIKTIDDLITIGKSYDSRKRKRYNLNLKQLHKLVPPLEELKAMVGMADVKKIIFDQLIYYLQNLDDKNVDMLHTVITGPPGVGKTQLTHIIAKIYNRLGFLKTDKVVCAKRDDLIGEYIGQTAPKTRKVLERALGGVLLLDEIYSLAPTSDRDFAREAIDMINMYLSEHAHDLVCVVAGYKKPTYEKFFSQNEGLARRFTHHFEIKGYTHNELAQIFKKYLESQKWLLGASLEEISEIIKGHMELFPNFGGDMATLFACCKKAHSRRLLCIPTEAELEATKKKIQKIDILEAVGIYKEIKDKHSLTDEEDKTKYMHMYS